MMNDRKLLQVQEPTVSTCFAFFEYSTVKSQFNEWPFGALNRDLTLTRNFLMGNSNFGHKISYLKLRFYGKSRFVKSRHYCNVHMSEE